MSNTAKTTADWNDLAQRDAREAHENFFSSRHGSFEPFDDRHISLFDNNPTLLRRLEHGQLRAWLDSRRFRIVGEGSYPETGEGAGYTTVFVIEVPEAVRCQFDIEIAWQDILRESIALASAENAS